MLLAGTLLEAMIFERFAWGREWCLESRFVASEKRGAHVANLLQRLWRDERGQDIAEYAVMLAVILVLVVGTIRLVGSNANNAFSSVASSIQ